MSPSDGKMVESAPRGFEFAEVPKHTLIVLNCFVDKLKWDGVQLNGTSNTALHVRRLAAFVK